MTPALLINFAATCAMFGLIWFIQLVHYPLFRLVGTIGSRTYQTEHMSRTTWVVAPLMCLEGITALWLALDPPPGISASLVWLGVLLLVLIWLSTALLQVPCHQSLLDGFDARIHQRLVRTNWIRTVAWTIRAILALYLLATPPV